MHVDFQVAEMVEESVVPLILGRSFMATVRAIIDFPSKRMSFANITERFFTRQFPPTQRHESYVIVDVPGKEVSGKGDVKEILDETLKSMP